MLVPDVSISVPVSDYDLTPTDTVAWYRVNCRFKLAKLPPVMAKICGRRSPSERTAVGCHRESESVSDMRVSSPSSVIGSCRVAALAPLRSTGGVFSPILEEKTSCDILCQRFLQAFTQIEPRSIAHWSYVRVSVQSPWRSTMVCGDDLPRGRRDILLEVAFPSINELRRRLFNSVFSATIRVFHTALNF